MSQPMQIHFEFTLEDFLAAERLHATRSLASRIEMILNYWIVPSIGALGLACALLLMRDRSSQDSAIILFVIAPLLLLYPFFLRARLKRAYIRNHSGPEERTMTFEPRRLVIEGPNSRSELNWKAIKSYRVGDKVMLIYLAPGRFIPIPKRACSAALIQELHSLLMRKLMIESN
jgi:hypothetical protein